MDMTTSTRVKEALGITDSGSDTLIAQLITAASNEIERVMDRHVLTTARTEVYPMRSVKRLVMLKACPVTNVSSVKLSSTYDFTTATALTANSDYILDTVGGVLRFLIDQQPQQNAYSGLALSPVFCQITYTAGMAVDASAFITAYPELAQACDMQCVHLFTRRSSPGTTSRSLSDSSAQYEGELGLLKIVEAAARRHKRLVWGG